MSKSKIIVFILLLLLIVSGLFGASMFSQKDVLEKEKAGLQSKLTQSEDLAKNLTLEKKRLSDQLTEATKDQERLEKQMSDFQAQVGAISIERDDWKGKVEALRKERDDLMAKLQEKTEPQVVIKEMSATQPTFEMPKIPEGEMKDRYWADVLKEKAILELKIKDLEGELSAVSIQIEESKKAKSDLELELSALKEQKQGIDRELKKSENLINSLSIDLAREKNYKRDISDQYEKTNEENMALRAQIKELSASRIALEKSIVRLSEDKQSVSQRLAETESIVQNRISEIMDIKKSLDQRLQTPVAGSHATKEVELPPIIINAPGPRSKGTKAQDSESGPGYNAKIVSVNTDNNFVIVDLGENDGIKVGDRLTVYRGTRYVADLEVIQVRKSISAADIRQRGTKIQIGDIVK